MGQVMVADLGNRSIDDLAYVNGGIKMPKCGRTKVYTSPHKNIEIHPGSECVNTPCFLRSLSR